MSKLLPCPFCGGKPHGAEPEVNINYVGCTECQACALNDAVWNTRRAPAPCDELKTIGYVHPTFVTELEYGHDEIFRTVRIPESWEPVITRQNAEEVIAAKDARIAELENAIKVKGGNEHYPTQDAYDLACKAIEKLRDRAAALEAENKRLREALEFYKDGFSYHPKRTKTGIDLSAWKPTEKLLDDCGETACAALGEVKP